MDTDRINFDMPIDIGNGYRAVAWWQNEGSPIVLITFEKNGQEFHFRADTAKDILIDVVPDDFPTMPTRWDNNPNPVILEICKYMHREYIVAEYNKLKDAGEV